jgi:nucleotide-binding universal stress UspA family protein
MSGDIYTLLTCFIILLILYQIRIIHMKKILIAIDGSDCSLRVVDYAAKQFSGIKDLHITLLHVLPYPPASMWDHGYMATNEKEKKGRDQAIEQWLAEQRSRAVPMFEKAVDVLTGEGIGLQHIEKKMISDSTEIADSILEEARDGGYMTLVMGKCEHSPVKDLFLGTVTTKVLKRGAGIAVSIIE